MSKNLEEAYKEYAQTQIPDLWDRIEAELPEKKVVKNVNRINKKEKILRKRVWATAAAAACLCLVFAGSGIYHLIGSKGEDQLTAIDKNAGVAADEALLDDAMAELIEMEKSAATDTATTDAATSIEEQESAQTEEMREQTVEESMTEDAASAREESLQMEDATNDFTESNDTTLDKEAGKAEETAALESESKSYDVVVTISDMENTGEEMLYYAVIVSADKRPVEVDGKVTFCISEDEVGPFEIGKTYSLRLTEREMQGTEIQPYLVTEVYGEQ